MTTNVSAVSGTTSTSQVADWQAGPPTSIAKDDLIRMRDEAAKRGDKTPEGIDTLIKNFDSAAGEGGSMTMEQFKAYAKSNGVTLPERSKDARGAGRSGGAPPAGGGGPSGGGGQVGGTQSSSSSSDVSSLSDAELQKKADQGDQKAAAELQRRQAMKLNASSDSGNAIDTYA